MIAIYIYLFIAGLFFGSFYACIAERLSEGKSIIYPGSHCVNCNHKLNWYELIPVFSYIFLKGKCSKCKIHLSIVYPLIEILTGVLFALSFHIFGFTLETIISIVVSSLVIITFVSDCKYMVILDEILIITGILIIILQAIQNGLVFAVMSLLHGVILFGIMLMIKLIGDRAFKTESLGWGDIKLSLIVGIVLGVKLGIIYIFLGAFLALPYAIIQTIRKKGNVLPFGPFLVLSLLLIYWNVDLVYSILKLLIGV